MTDGNINTLLVFNIGFTIGVDGPGQRMVVYLKGCNMRCPWCASPESVNPSPEVMFYPSRVEEPLRLSNACPRGAIKDMERNTAICASCEDFPCLDSHSRAFELAGEEIAIESLVEKALRYKSFFGKRGGVTIGGGEPTCQFDAAHNLLEQFKSNNIHTAMETNGTNPRLVELFPLIDLLYIDLKHPKDAESTRLTGQGNRITLDNIRQRYEHGGDMVVRICLVPGCNSDTETLRAFGEVLSSIGALNVELLPFHRRGEPKWRALGREMPVTVAEMKAEELAAARETLSDFGLNVL